MKTSIAKMTREVLNQDIQHISLRVDDKHGGFCVFHAREMEDGEIEISIDAYGAKVERGQRIEFISGYYDSSLDKYDSVVRFLTYSGPLLKKSEG